METVTRHDPVRPRPLGVWALVASTLFLSLSALFGGLNLLRDPTGDGIDLVMPVDLGHLAGTPFTDYTIPGLVLVVVLGLYPLAVLYGQLTRRPLAWPASLAMAGALAVWVLVEVALIGYVSPLQPAYGLLGVALALLCFAPSVRTYYRAH